MLEYVSEEVRKLNRVGAREICIVQSRRYLGDIVSVDGKWYAVKLDTDVCGDVVVHSGNRCAVREEYIDVPEWVDENGRAITDAKG